MLLAQAISHKIFLLNTGSLFSLKMQSTLVRSGASRPGSWPVGLCIISLCRIMGTSNPLKMMYSPLDANHPVYFISSFVLIYYPGCGMEDLYAGLFTVHNQKIPPRMLFSLCPWLWPQMSSLPCCHSLGKELESPGNWCTQS